MTFEGLTNTVSLRHRREKPVSESKSRCLNHTGHDDTDDHGQHRINRQMNEVSRCERKTQRYRPFDSEIDCHVPEIDGTRVSADRSERITDVRNHAGIRSPGGTHSQENNDSESDRIDREPDGVHVSRFAGTVSKRCQTSCRGEQKDETPCSDEGCHLTGK